MPTLLPRVKVTLDPDVQDRLDALGACWGVSVAGLLRCVAERIAEGVQLMELRDGRRVFVRGGHLPPALLALIGTDARSGKDAVQAAGELLDLYGPDAPSPAITFRPPDLSPDQVLQGCEEALRRAPSGKLPGEVVPIRSRSRRGRREDGATAPPAATPQPSVGPSQGGPTPVGNTGVTLPQGAAPGRPRARKSGS